MKYYLAIDIGASSGRHIIGYKNNDIIKTDEVYRFNNSVIIDENNSLIWDIEYLVSEVKKGISIALRKYPSIESLSIDTWGVDYVLLNNGKEVLPVYSYRDNRTKSIIDKVHKIISFKDLYKITGCQFQQFNTLYQLYADKKASRLDNVTDFLFIPEYIIYRLTNIICHEYTMASTSGLVDGESFEYSDIIINKLGFNKKLFKKLDKTKKIVGQFSDAIAKEVGGNIKVVLCATHDTASAVEGIQMDSSSLYISSGTWSLLGVKTNHVIKDEKALIANYSNEYGPNYVRFQKNIMGLWIIQKLAKELEISFEDMINLAQTSSYLELYDVNDNVFLNPENMKDAILKWFSKNNRILPVNNADIINSTFHSLAYSYMMAIKEIEEITGCEYNDLYIVGGGAKNKYLNVLTKEYTKKNVIALPIEATATGNILVQMEINNER